MENLKEKSSNDELQELETENKQSTHSPQTENEDNEKPTLSSVSSNVSGGFDILSSVLPENAAKVIATYGKKVHVVGGLSALFSGDEGEQAGWLAGGGSY